MSRELATLAADPERVEDLKPDALPALLGEIEMLRARLWARLQATSVSGATDPLPSATESADRMLTAGEAATSLGVSKRWIYRKADELPFTRRLGPNTLRFSERGLERWKERQR